MNLRRRAAILAGRSAGWASRVTGRGAGTQVSGRIMLAVDPDLLATVGAADRVVTVSATNGKTTTTRLLHDALRHAGLPVVTNHTGANMASGLAAALAAPHPPSVAVLEVDERWLTHVVGPLDPEVLVFGNLSRDQLDRFGEVHAIVDRWRAITEADPDRHVVANSSDPHVVHAAAPARRITWVALGIPWRQDATTCPRCDALLGWPEDRFRCDGCGFAEPEAAYRLEAGALVVGDRSIPIDLAVPGTWNLMNAALAATVAEAHFDVPAETAVAGMRGVEVVSGRFAQHRLPDGRAARVVLAKNPAGWTEVLHWLSGRDTGVVLAVNAHIADGRDPSWLYDVPFEVLRDRPVVASGERALDVAVRLHYGEVACAVETDPLTAARTVAGAEVHIVASYTQFTRLTKEFW
ncbi:MAG: MurT ligase domain-containing protein [Actinomycetes bacterium]